MEQQVCHFCATVGDILTMKILVTGATGFIGNYVIRQFISLGGDNVIAATSQREDKAKEQEWYGKTEYIPCNLYQDMDFKTLFGEPDIIIHLAWKGLPNYDETFHFEENLYYDYRFLKQMVEAGVKKIVITGTCFEYGLQAGCLSEDIETKPCTNYGFAKDILRKMMERLLVRHPETSLCWARLFYMYGKGQNEKSFVPMLKKAIEKNAEIFNMSGGEQLRDFLPVEKIAEKIILLALHKNAKGIYNICSGKPKSLRTLAEDIIKKEKSGIKLNLGYYSYPDYESMAFWGNNTKYENL